MLSFRKSPVFPTHTYKICTEFLYLRSVNACLLSAALEVNILKIIFLTAKGCLSVFQLDTFALAFTENVILKSVSKSCIRFFHQQFSSIQFLVSAECFR